ncbi:MAG: HNH endonuclease [bacterium]|nr:HNH endonuclease [bacterium]
MIDRRHDPPEAQGRYGYRTYRACLRWEFGFTCPFCLCHEADFVPRGAEGFGVTQIEHFVPVSHKGTNLYPNCFYICRFCNRARSAAANVDPEDGRRLLSPTSSVWAEHFVVAGDEIEAREGSDDAAYTRDAYDLNDHRKAARRRYRREAIDECLAMVRESGSICRRLLEDAVATHKPELVDAAKAIEAGLRRAWRDLEVFEVVPPDAPSRCACDVEAPSIPRLLEEQSIEIRAPAFEGGDGAPA